MHDTDEELGLRPKKFPHLEFNEGMMNLQRIKEIAIEAGEY